MRKGKHFFDNHEKKKDFVDFVAKKNVS